MGGTDWSKIVQINRFLIDIFSKRQRITLRLLYAMSRPSVCLSVVCLSVVCDVGAPYSGGLTFRQFFSPYDSPGTLLFWCQKSLVGNAPFPLKFAFKVTHPLSNYEISTNIGSYSASAGIASERSSISTYRKSTTRFPTSHR